MKSVARKIREEILERKKLPVNTMREFESKNPLRYLDAFQKASKN